ncbi:MAG TPA: ATP F0F1 synthase subunit B [Caulobacteraceae bacterium]|nr:ATP F0F1 synthase subunit B [Caulobacteraceae bacterium]
MSLLTNAEFWIAVALVVLIGVLIYARVPSLAAQALDARGAKIKAELDEALRLRQEAEALLEGIKADRERAEKTAAEIVASAEADAARLRTEAEARLAEQIDRRRAMAERHIANAEAKAATDVKVAAAEAAAALAQAIMAERLDGLASDPLVDRAVEDLAQRLR